MPSARERAPIGLTNVNTNINNTNQGLVSPLVTNRTARSQPATGRSAPKEANDYFQKTGRSTDTSVLSTNEVLRRLREKSDKEKNAIDQQEINALGEYNAFSRPRVSMNMPLRSVFLDNTVNNFPHSRTQSELLKRIKGRGTPHPSYDLDQDGYVSQDDYRLAKRFDLDGNGVLDPDERAIGKRVLADEFFKGHAHDLECFGPSFPKFTHAQNVDRLAKSQCFERAYEKLKSIERSLIARSAKPILECMQLPDDTLTRHNFYTDKFDCTAWNDFDAIPRAASQFGLDNHGGSRKRLMFSRKQATCEGNQVKMIEAEARKPNKVNTRRLALITNVAIENN